MTYNEMCPKTNHNRSNPNRKMFIRWQNLLLFDEQLHNIFTDYSSVTGNDDRIHLIQYNNMNAIPH